MDTERHPLLLEVDVETGNLRIRNPRRHGLGSDCAVQGVTLDEGRLQRALSVSLQDVDRLHRVFCLVAVVSRLDGLHGVDTHVGEEVGIGTDDLGGHGGLRDVDEGLATEGIDGGRHGVIHEPDGFAESNTVSGDNSGGVNAVLNEIVCAADELGGEDND